MSLEYARACSDFNLRIIRELKDSHGPLNVIISSEFALEEKVLWTSAGRRINYNERTDELRRDIETIIGQLKAFGHSVTLVSPPPKPVMILVNAFLKQNDLVSPWPNVIFKKIKFLIRVFLMCLIDWTKM